MASDLLSLADASELLGVTSERVRQLVVAGDLPGVRFGNAWAVPSDAVAARGRASNRRGRPLSAIRAWEAIGAGDIELSNASRYRNRAELRRFSVRPRDLDYVIQQQDSLQSGGSAAVAYGEPLMSPPGQADIYAPNRVMDELSDVIALVPDPFGAVIIRVVPNDLWGKVAELALDSDDGRFAPAAAVALDLMESADPRFWIAADELVLRA